MFRFKNVFLVVLLFSCSLMAQDIFNVAKTRFQIFSVGYFSWKERLVVQKSGTTEFEKAQITGIDLHWEHAFYKNRWGFVPGVSLLAGGATGGSSEGTIDYTSNRYSMLGGHAQAKLEYRINPQFHLGVSPGLIYRKINWQPDSGITLSTASDFNFSMLLEQKIRLTPDWDLRMKIGSLTLNATTYWGLDLGHYF